MNKKLLSCLAFLTLIAQSLQAHPDGHGAPTYTHFQPSPNAHDDLAVLAALLIFALTTCITVARLGIAWTRSLSGLALLIGLTISLSACAQRSSKPKGPRPQALDHFLPFKDQLQLNWDGDWLLIGSNGFPDHPMMVGITNWQQQVPIPQPFSGKNAWRIPIAPQKTSNPISTRNNLLRGAIAVAVNGVPIFNALNNRGEDAFLIGELDEFGGHCGKGDDYHYHTAPLHLEKVVGKGNPIAYALDGYPIMPPTDSTGKIPNNLDECHGRLEADGKYRYYASKTYPYTLSAMRGVVQVRGDGIEPQPKDSPSRPPGRPLRGAKITAFERDEPNKTYTLRYTLQGSEHQIRYTLNGEKSVDFTFTNPSGNTTSESYKRRR